MNTRGPTAGRRGMTLVEGMIASVILSILFGLAWQLFRAGARSAELAAWHTKCQQQLRNGLRLLRDDLSKASYPSEVSPTAVTVTRPGYGLKYKLGKQQLSEDGGSLPLLDFWICRPTKSGFGGGEDDSGEKIHATLECQGNTIRYKKEGALDKVRNCDRVLFDEVEYVFVDGPPSAPGGKATTCAIEVKTIHRIRKTSGVMERTMPKVEVEVASGL